MLFKLSHHKVLRIAMQVLQLLFQMNKLIGDVVVEGEKGGFGNRFYRTLYEIIMRVSLAKASKMDDYFGLLFKAMRADK